MSAMTITKVDLKQMDSAIDDIQHIVSMLSVAAEWRPTPKLLRWASNEVSEELLKLKLIRNKLG